MLRGNSPPGQEPAPELDSQVLGWLWHDFPNSLFSAKEVCHHVNPGTQSLPQQKPLTPQRLSLLALLL